MTPSPEKLSEKVIDPTAVEDDSPVIPSDETEKPEPSGNLNAMPEELVEEFGEQLDVMLCVGVTALGRRRNPNFGMSREEIKELRWGRTLAKLLNFYLPQLNVESPWPPFVLASIGLGSVVFAKMQSTPKPEPVKAAETPKPKPKVTPIEAPKEPENTSDPKVGGPPDEKSRE